MDTTLHKENLQFISLAAHELKAPISVLKLLTQLQKAKYQKDGVCMMGIDEFEMLQRELDRLTNLVNNLLDLQYLQDAKLNLKLKVVNLTSLVGEAINMISFSRNGHRIIFYNEHYLVCSSKGQSLCSHKIENPQINITADPDRIRQVLINLLSNAIKYSPANTQIKVLVKEDKTKVTVSIKDYGVGIPKNSQSLIFKQFYRVKPKHKHGLGLGLFISKKIVDAHNGKIWVNSKIGAGSKFSFELNKKSVAQTTELN